MKEQVVMIVFYRTKSGIKSYFSIFEGFKVKDMYVMHANKMTWEEFTELPEIEE
jgi:hypothetical protein